MKPLLLLPLLLLSPLLHAQSYLHFYHYTVENGLPNNIGYEMMQDGKGFLWIATDVGLARFDGSEFRNYGANEGLENPFVVGMDTLADGSLYVNNYRAGFQELSDEGRFLPTKKLPRTKNMDMQFVHGDVDHYLLFLRTGLLYYKGAEGYFKVTKSGPSDVFHLKPLAGTAEEATRAHLDLVGFPFTETREGLILLDNSKGLLLFDEAMLVLRPYKVDGFPNETAFSYAEAKDGTRWLGGQGQIFGVDAAGRAARQALAECPFPISNIKACGPYLYFTDPGRLHLYRVKKGSGRAELLDEALGISTTYSCIYADGFDNLWITTNGDGLYCIPLELGKSFTGREGLSGAEIRGFHEYKDGMVCIGNSGGIDIYDPVQGTLRSGHMKETPLWMSTFTNGEAWMTFTGEHIVKSVGTSQELLSIKTLEIDSSFIDVGILKMRGVPGDARGTKSFNANIFYAERNERGEEVVWGRAIKIDLLDRQKYERRMSQNSAPLPETELVLVNYALRVGAGAYAVATNAGLWVLNDQDSLRIYTKAQGLPDDQVGCIAATSSGAYFLGTENGICLWQNQRIEPVPMEGLSDRRCRNIFVDKSGRLWVATPTGLFYFDQGRFYGLNVYSGLISNDIRCLFQDSKDNIWVGTSRGVTMIQPNVHVLKAPPPLLYWELILNNEDTIPPLARAKFAGDNQIRVKLALVAYTSSQNLLLEYRLHEKGEWQSFTGRELRFQNLEAGAYRLEVRARRMDSEWSKPISWGFSVELPFYKKVFFWVLCALLGVAGTFVYYRYELKKIRKRNAQKAENERHIARIELNALQAQMNPHFLFNSLNTVMHFAMQEDKLSVNNYLSKFSRLMRFFLEASKSSYVLLRDEIEQLKLYVELEQLRRICEFSVHFDIDPTLNKDVFALPGNLIQPFVENAIYHGLRHKKAPGNLYIRMRAEGKGLVCSVEDDGIGREAAASYNRSREHHISRGTQLIIERIQAINSIGSFQLAVQIIDLRDGEGESTGTRVDIKVLPN